MIFIYLSILVCAANFPNGNQNQFAFELDKGWNLVYGFMGINQIISGSWFEKEDIKAIYAFIPTTQEYLRAWPDPDGDKWQNLDEIFDDHELLQTSFWVYSNKEGSMEYNLIDTFEPVEQKKLYKGWNFFVISPDLIYDDVNLGRLLDNKVTFDSIKGDCKLEKAYYFKSNSWHKGGFSDYFDRESLGSGVIVKVSNDCRLGSSQSGTIVAPPELPRSTAENSGLRKDVENYYFEEIAYETCELNPFENSGFASETECKDSILCIAVKFASIVPENDLASLAQDMKENGGESGYINYRDNNPAIEGQMTQYISACLP